MSSYSILTGNMSVYWAPNAYESHLKLVQYNIMLSAFGKGPNTNFSLLKKRAPD